MSMKLLPISSVKSENTTRFAKEFFVTRLDLKLKISEFFFPRINKQDDLFMGVEVSPGASEEGIMMMMEVQVAAVVV